MCFVKSKYEIKTQLFTHNKYFAVLYRSFVNMLKRNIKQKFTQQSLQNN